MQAAVLWEPLPAAVTLARNAGCCHQAAFAALRISMRHSSSSALQQDEHAIDGKTAGGLFGWCIVHV
jgi:hypothetical protein